MYPNSREDAVLEKLTYYKIYIKGGISYERVIKYPFIIWRVN